LLLNLKEFITFEKSITKKTDVNDKKAKNGIKSQVLMYPNRENDFFKVSFSFSK
jgi:hypothetical protein